MGARVSLVAAFVATLAWAGTAAADIYECRRADGSLHYTNTRQPGMRCTVFVRGSRSAARATPTAQVSSGGRRATRSGTSVAPGLDAVIREAARLYQLPEAFIRAVVRVESNFSPEVISHAGAVGLMQLMPRTASSMGVRNAFDPRENIFGGVRYLRVLANQFNGDLVLTVAAYNAGAGAVERYRGVPPYAETQRYVRNVLRYYYAYRSGRT